MHKNSKGTRAFKQVYVVLKESARHSALRLRVGLPVAQHRHGHAELALGPCGQACEQRRRMVIIFLG